MDVVAQIYASMRSGNVADFLSKLSGGHLHQRRHFASKFSLNIAAELYDAQRHASAFNYNWIVTPARFLPQTTWNGAFLAGQQPILQRSWYPMRECTGPRQR